MKVWIWLLSVLSKTWMIITEQYFCKNDNYRFNKQTLNYWQIDHIAFGKNNKHWLLTLIKFELFLVC